MINENYGNAFFGVMSVSTLLASITHSEYITDNVKISKEYYFGALTGIVITCLFTNICLGIFSLFVLGNLSDYIQKMTVNLIGARQKLRVLAILIFMSFVFYTGANLLSFARKMSLDNVETKLAIIGMAVSVLQIFHIFSIHLIHPDVFGLKYLSKMKSYDKYKKSRVFYI